MTDEQLRRLGQCESGIDYKARDGGYSGAVQWQAGTWASMDTGYASAADAPPDVQDDAARRLYTRNGRGSWPVCGPRAGL